MRLYLFSDERLSSGYPDQVLRTGHITCSSFVEIVFKKAAT